MRHRLLSAALFSLTLAGCASMRGIEVQSDTAESYAINVYNSRSSTVDVSYEAGSETRVLGSVGPDRTERFVVVSSVPTIRLLAQTSTGAILSSYTVSLTKSPTPTVTIR